MRAILFAGQGSQRRGMGGDLFDRFPDLCDIADKVLGYSVRELCLSDPAGRLGDTAYAQPAIYVVNAMRHLAEAGTDPDFLAGHSLGEFNALLAAGCLDFETGLRLVRHRGRLMGAANGGGMLAVLGAPAETVIDLVAGSGEDGVEVANYNTPSQLVLSGPKESIVRVAALLGGRPGVRCVPLRVSAAFHSAQMAPAAAEFAELLSTVELHPPRVPVIANVTARPYLPTQVAATLAQQVCAPVRWSDSMRYLLQRGVTEVAEVSTRPVLTEMWEAVRRDVAAAWNGKPQAVSAAQPGSAAFRADYGVRHAYLAGSMYRGISSVDLVVRMGRAGLLGFLGTGGMSLPEIEAALTELRSRLGPDGRYGMNLLHAVGEPELERDTVALFLREDVRFVEAAGFLGVTPPLVRYRLSGAHRRPDGMLVARRVVAKVSRPDVAEAFLAPAPAAMVAGLVSAGELTAEEAELAAYLPVAGDVCAEADSGGHTDGAVALALLPSMRRLCDDAMRQHRFAEPIRIGAAGGLGSPEAVAAAFVLGAEFVVTGSVNQCSPEAGTSAAVKDLLASLDVQDTTYAPSGDMFELGSRVQVVRRGTLFAAHANRLYQLYRQYGSWEEIDERTRRSVESGIFRRSAAEVWRDTADYYRRTGRPEQVAKAEADPRHRMVLMFKWYFAHSARVALDGTESERAHFQVHCGPAMGAFNRFARGTPLADWRNRHVDAIADALMTGAAEVLSARPGDAQL